MQPTFLPWLGYFSLINSVEKFVFLDHVQFEPRSWQQRNRILINNEIHWLTVPVTLPSGRATKISEVLISQEHYSSTRIKQTLIHAYSKSDWAKITIDRLFPFLESSTKYLSVMNKALIINISNQMGIETEFIDASTIGAEGKKASLLLNICKGLGATTYISPVGSRVYLDDFMGFKESEIQVEYQSHTPPIYSQLSTEFISHLSIIDALCNIGAEKTAHLVKDELTNGN